MPTARPFAYNTGSTIEGTLQIGSLAIGVDSIDYAGGVGGVKWWNGPDEDLGYVIAHSTPSGNQPNSEGVPAFVGFWRSEFFSEQSFVGLSEYVSILHGDQQTFTSGAGAKNWLNINGYWTSFEPIPEPTPTVTPTISLTPSITPTIDLTTTPTITQTQTPTITQTNTLSPTPTKTQTPTPSLSVSPSWNSIGATILECCDNSFTYIGIRLPLDAFIGGFVSYDNGTGSLCYEITELGNFSTNSAQVDNVYANCDTCRTDPKVNIGPCPVTPTPTVTITPTVTPTITPSSAGGIITSNLVMELEGSSYTSGTWTDESGNGNNATINGATWSSTDGGIFDLDGLNDTISIAHNSNLSLTTTGQRTIQVWVKFDTLPALNTQGQPVFGKLSSSFSFDGYWGGLYSNTANVRCVTNGASIQRVSTSTLTVTTGTWYLYTFISQITSTSNTTKVYINETEYITTAHGSDTISETNPLYLGFIGTGVSSPYLDGKIGACYFYTTGLSAANISTNFNATKSRYGL